MSDAQHERPLLRRYFGIHLSELDDLWKGPLAMREFLTLLFILAAVPVPGMAQAPPSSFPIELVPCADPASIEMSRILRLGDQPDGTLVGETEVVARDSRGRVYLATPEARGVVSVFDRQGYLLATFGREGSGEGEYGLIYSLLVTAGDTLHVVDYTNQRISTLSPELVVSRVTPLPGAPTINGVLQLTPESWGINANLRSPDEVGWPLHVLDAQGRLQRSFGIDLPVFRNDLALFGRRTIGQATGGGLWVSLKTEYRVEEWAVSNQMQRSFVRRAPWFPSWNRNNPIGPDAPRMPVVQDIRMDSSGLVWVLITMPSVRWRDFVGEYEPGRYYFTSIPDYHASVVEVIDPAAECVLAHLESEVFLRHSLTDDHQYAAYAREGEVDYIDLWRLSLTRSPPRRPSHLPGDMR